MAPRLAVQRGAYSESLRAGRPRARPNDEPPAKQSRSAYDMSLRVPHAAWAACAPARTSRRHCERVCPQHVLTKSDQRSNLIPAFERLLRARRRLSQ